MKLPFFRHTSANNSFKAQRINGYARNQSMRSLQLTAMLLSLAGLYTATAASAEENTISSEERGELEITSDTLDMSFAERKAVFQGNVKVTDERMILTADKMDVYLTAENELQQIEALGNVVIKERGTERRATAGKGVYNVAEEVVTLTEKPTVTMEENSIINAAVIVYQRKTETFQFSGDDEERPRIRFTPSQTIGDGETQGKSE